MINSLIDSILVFHGRCHIDDTIVLDPVDLISGPKFPQYGSRIFSEITLVGKNEKNSVLFKYHPYELISTTRRLGEVVPRRFAFGVRYMDDLNSVEVFYRDKLVETLSRRKEAVIKLDTEIDSEKNQVTLSVFGTYQRLTVTVHDQRSSQWTHVYMDDDQTEEETKRVEIPWSRFPPAEHAVIRAVAVQGINVAEHHSKPIAVEIQPVPILLFVADFIELQPKTGDYVFIFGAKASLHGQSIPAENYQWSIVGKEYSGQYVTIKRRGRRNFKVEVEVSDKLKRTFTSEMLVDVKELLKKASKKTG